MKPCTSGTLAVPGARLHFEERGEGPLLLLVAGGNSDAAVFTRLAASLAADHRVVTYDPRGNSRSALDSPPGEQRIEEHVDDAVRLLDHLAGPAEPAHVFGSCSGGLVALELAARHPDRVRRTVAHEPPVLAVLPDSRDHLALVDEACETFRRAGPAPAMRVLRALYGGAPAPTLPEAHDNTVFFLAHVVRPAARFVPDLAALAAVADRVALAAAGTPARTSSTGPRSCSRSAWAVRWRCSPAATPATRGTRTRSHTGWRRCSRPCRVRRPHPARRRTRAADGGRSGDMRIVMGAQNCGFGPAAELVAVSRLLHGHERVFVGSGVAAVFARRNPDAFDITRTTDGMPPETADAVTDELVGDCDQVVSVMDADLVLRAVVAGRPVIMVDSLFGFWRVRRPLERIHELCARLPRSTPDAARRHLADLSPHEHIVAAHLLATHSVVQNFPGVARRAAQLAALGGGFTARPVGPLVDVEGLRAVERDAVPTHDLLIDIGGFKNFLLDFDVHNDYLLLLRRWLPDLLRDWPRFRRVLVCGGPFGGHRQRAVSVAGRRADCRLVRQRDLLQTVATTPYHLLAPGLTALHEALALGRLPLAMHEQHVAHVFTVRSLAGTLFGRSAGRFADVLPHHAVPEDDLAGTIALVEAAARVREDDTLYARFRRTFNERIEHYVALTPAQRRHGVEELRELLDGEPVRTVLRGIIAPPAGAEAAGAEGNGRRGGGCEEPGAG
ncbi:alpha/beta fold hydrolase [Streptomyces sp. Act-28]